MKKSDIHVGSEYAYTTHEWSTRQRVKVLGGASIRQGWGYSAKTIQGSRVQVLDTVTGEPAKRLDRESGEMVDWIIETANRNIREEWAPYAEREAAKAKARRDSARALADNRDARARVLLDLIPAMREAGFADIDYAINDSKVISALSAHVEDCLEERPDRYGREGQTEIWLVAPLARDLYEYVKDGGPIGVPGPTLLRLLQRGNIR